MGIWDGRRLRPRALSDREDRQFVGADWPIDGDSVWQRFSEYEGRQAILYEPPLLARVVLTDIRADQSGLTVSYLSIAPSGHSIAPESSGMLHAVWEVLEVSETRWTARYVGWTLYLDPDGLLLD
jgi:hypothetical protein